jgi:alkylated DNA repair dioxygenase AlkB
LHDTPDLFAQASDPSAAWLPVPMADANVALLTTPVWPEPTAVLLQTITEQTPWRQDSIVLWGKSHLQPRLSAWYGDPNSRYTYSGLAMNPLPWTPLLARLKAQVEAWCQTPFNSVLLNLYRDQRDSMGMHSDDEPELGAQPAIASVSLGETRTLVFKHRHQPALATVRVPLTDGSLMLMRGATQAHWKHGIAKQTRPLGPRLNLTFRLIRA